MPEQLRIGDKVRSRARGGQAVIRGVIVSVSRSVTGQRAMIRTDDGTCRWRDLRDLTRDD